MPPKGLIMTFDLGPQLVPVSSDFTPTGGEFHPLLGVKFEVFCCALKPVFGLSGNGLQRASDLQGSTTNKGDAPLPHPQPLWVRPCLEASRNQYLFSSGKRKDGLEIGKDR